MRDAPIGIFDSGIGGLTVAKAILEYLPNEQLIYLGDTARVPYGNRGSDVITQYSLELTRYIQACGVKLIIVACNTMSATCLDAITHAAHVPVIGVIKPAAAVIVASTTSGKIGIIGTRATISSGAYEREIHSIDPKICITTQACPLFVPLTEEGWLHSEATRIIAREYLKPLTEKDIDVLHLGCTHYPLLRETIAEIMGNIRIIDSAHPTAQKAAEILNKKGLRRQKNQNASHSHFLFTDSSGRTHEQFRLFFDGKLPGDIRHIHLSEVAT